MTDTDLDKARHVGEEPDVFRALGNIADVLERASYRIRSRAGLRVGVSLHDLHEDWADLARDVAHDVQNCNANLNLDALILACANADRAARTPEEAPECLAWFGDRTAAGASTCRRPAGHPPISEDGVGHDTRPIPLLPEEDQ